MKPTAIEILLCRASITGQTIIDPRTGACIDRLQRYSGVTYLGWVVSGDVVTEDEAKRVLLASQYITLDQPKMRKGHSPYASPACIKICLNTSGQGGICDSVQSARLDRSMISERTGQIGSPRQVRKETR